MCGCAIVARDGLFVKCPTWGTSDQFVDGAYESDMLACCVANLVNSPAIAVDPRLAGYHFEFHSHSLRINQRIPGTMIMQREFSVSTNGRGTYDLTAKIESAVKSSGIQTGLCNIFVCHTSASLMLCENADPAVMADLETFMQRTAPDGDPAFTHTDEGPDDMPAHIRSILTQSDLNIPVSNGHCALGTWQGIYLWEHRLVPHERNVILTIHGDG